MQTPKIQRISLWTDFLNCEILISGLPRAGIWQYASLEYSIVHRSIGFGAAICATYECQSSVEVWAGEGAEEVYHKQSKF